MASSSDGGRSFDRSSVVADNIGPPQRVMLIYTMPPASVAADDSGRLLVAWTDARHGRWDVLARRSPDGGRTWEAMVRLNDDPVSAGRHHYMPRLSVSPTGRFDAIFYDRRNDPENVRNDVFYTYSTDGGHSFEANVRLTAENFDSRRGTRYPIPSAVGQHEFGSRIALLSRDTSVVAAWTDTRNNRVGVAQDVFATEVDLPESGHGVPWLLPAGGALALGAVLVAVVASRRGWWRRVRGVFWGWGVP